MIQRFTFLGLGLLLLMPFFLLAQTIHSQEGVFEENAIFVKLKNGTPLTTLIVSNNDENTVFNAQLQAFSLTGIEQVSSQAL